MTSVPWCQAFCCPPPEHPGADASQIQLSATAGREREKKKKKTCCEYLFIFFILAGADKLVEADVLARLCATPAADYLRIQPAHCVEA